MSSEPAAAQLYSQRSSDEPKAFELATKARQAYPEDPEIAKALGILSYRRGFLAQSAQLLKEAAAKRKDDSELLRYLEEVSGELGQQSECKRPSQEAPSFSLSLGLYDAMQPPSGCTVTSPPAKP